MPLYTYFWQNYLKSGCVVRNCPFNWKFSVCEVLIISTGIGFSVWCDGSCQSCMLSTVSEGRDCFGRSEGLWCSTRLKALRNEERQWKQPNEKMLPIYRTILKTVCHAVVMNALPAQKFKVAPKQKTADLLVMRSDLPLTVRSVPGNYRVGLGWNAFSFSAAERRKNC